MTHDPLCPLGQACTLGSRDGFHVFYEIHAGLTACDCCDRTCCCDVISQIRADERSRCIAEVKALGPLQQFQEGYFIWGRKTVDVDRILRSQP